MTKSHWLYLGLGSNLGDRSSLLKQAIRLVGEQIGEVVCQSSFMETEPWGFETENCFLNGVILCKTRLTPREVLEATQQIEHELGKGQEHATWRTQNQSPTYKDRPIDIDILRYDDLTTDEPDLKIPHPLMRERDFVMKPLREIEARLNIKLKF